MKTYKATYGVSMLMFLLKFLVCALPVFVFLCVIIPMDGRYTFWQMLWLLPTTIIGCIVPYGLLFLLINIVTKSFTKNIVAINEDEIIYKNQKLPLHKVEFLTLHLPKLARSLSEPQELVIRINSESSLNIRRPSFSLIYRLKKECKDAKFEILDLKSEIKTDLIIGLVVSVFFAVILLISFFNK